MHFQAIIDYLVNGDMVLNLEDTLRKLFEKLYEIKNPENYWDSQ